MTDAEAKAAKPRQKPYKLADAGGLYLQVAPGGGRYWRFKYRVAGKEKLLSIGVYPEVSLKEARERRDDARRMLRDNRDPGAERRETRLAQVEAERVAGSTFKAVAAEWLEKASPKWSAGHAGTVTDRLKNDVFPWIGDKPVSAIEPPALLAVIRRIEERGAPEVARRVLQSCSQVLAYAVATGAAIRNPASDLRGAVPPPPKGHHASITDPREVGGLLRAIDGFQGQFVTRCALRFAPLVFVRPGELRHAEWSEFNLEVAEWRIPAHKMKARDLHIVPLSTQALAILDELRPLTGTGRYLFPGVRASDRPMSENTVTAALRRMGYTGDEMTGHGFRTMASTLLNEQGWHRDAIERQLAHGERNKVRAAYNRAEHLPERRKMMQAWADYLDGLRASTNVVPIRRGA
jgi:integrase